MFKKWISQKTEENFKNKIVNKALEVSQKIKQARELKSQLEQQYNQLQKQNPNISKEIQELHNETISKYQKLEKPLYLILQYPNYQEMGWRANIIIHEKEIRWMYSKDGHKFGLIYDPYSTYHNEYVSFSNKEKNKDIEIELKMDKLSRKRQKITCAYGPYGAKIEVIKSHDQKETHYRFCMPEKIRQAFNQYLPTFKSIIEQEENFETLNQALSNIKELIIEAQHTIQIIQQDIDFNAQQKQLLPEEQMDKEMKKYIDLKIQV